MVHAKNYETASESVKVMLKIPWPLFFQTRCILARLAKYKMHQKMPNWLFCQVLTITSEANSSLSDAYSMLHIHQQSYNPLVDKMNYFNICYQIGVPFLGRYAEMG